MSVTKREFGFTTRYNVYEPDDRLVSPLLRQNVRRWHDRTDPINILPHPDGEGYILSNDPKIDVWKHRIAKACDEALPVELSDHGYALNGVTSNFSSLKTDCAPAKQLVIPMCDNTQAREELGLNNSFTTVAHLRIGRELARVMLGGWKPGNVKVAKGSSSGFPFFYTDSVKKKEHFNRVFPYFDDVITKAHKGQLDSIYRKYQMLFAYRQNIRKQADGWTMENGKYGHSKDRPTHDLEFVVSGGTRGRQFTVDKECPWSDLLALARTRTVYGLANLPNAFQGVIFEGHNQYLHANYGRTFVHHGSAETTEKIHHFTKTPYLVCVDTSNHDFLAAKHVLELMFERLEELWDERIVSFIRRCWSAPIYCKSPDVYGDPDPFWLGHPLVNADFDRWYGVPSGTFLVTFAGKFGCMLVYLTMLHDIGIDVIGRIDEILRWEHPDVAIADLGDDAYVLFADEANRDKYHDYVRDGGNKIYKVDVEPNGFLGDVMCANRDESKVWVTSNPVSFPRNVLVPENGLGTFFKKYWAMGWEAKLTHYSANSATKPVLEVMERETRDVLGFDLQKAIRNHKDMSLRPDIHDLTMAEADVLLDPSKIFYRYEGEEIRDELLELYASNITPDEYVDTVSQYYNGIIV